MNILITKKRQSWDRHIFVEGIRQDAETQGAETELMQFDRVNIIVPDALAPCVTRTPAPMILCRIDKFLSYMRKDFNYQCHVSVEEWYKL